MFRQKALFIISTCNLKGVGHLMSFMCMIYTFSLPFGMVYIIRFYITYKIYSKYIVDGVLLCSIFSYVNTTYYYEFALCLTAIYNHCKNLYNIKVPNKPKLECLHHVWN